MADKHSLNAKRAPWVSDPWVVAITFVQHLCNIDKTEARDALL